MQVCDLLCSLCKFEKLKTYGRSDVRSEEIKNLKISELFRICFAIYIFFYVICVYEYAGKDALGNEV